MRIYTLYSDLTDLLTVLLCSVVKEAQDCFGYAVRIGCLLSVGTGIDSRVVLPDLTLSNSVGFAKGLAAIATSCERTHHAVEGLSRGFQRTGDDKYFRFNMGTFLSAAWHQKTGAIAWLKRRFVDQREWRDDNWEKLIGLDDWEGMVKFGEATAEYMDLAEQQARATICAARLTPVRARAAVGSS